VIARGAGRWAMGVMAAGLMTLAVPVGAQQNADSVFARARQLVVNGNGAAGRLLIDSVLTATPSESPVFGEGLYWRAALAASSADAERDYRRLVIEYPFSSHSGDALLQLAQIENARGDRVGAALHLQRFLLDNPASDQRARAGMLLVRLLFDQNDLVRGCAALRSTLAEIPEAQVETRNQLEYYSPRCSAAGLSAAAKAKAVTDSTAKADSVKAAHVAEPKAKYTLQIAAYKSKAEAEALVKKLVARKIDARLAGNAKLYRVRVGHYATRGAAVAAQQELKAKKISAFVTDIGADDK
jgi:hypothetical protein